MTASAASATGGASPARRDSIRRLRRTRRDMKARSVYHKADASRAPTGTRASEGRASPEAAGLALMANPHTQRRGI